MNYIVAIDSLDGKKVQIKVDVNGVGYSTAYAILSVDQSGASIVDNGYRSIDEARKAWPEAIAPTPAVHLTPQQADAEAIVQQCSFSGSEFSCSKSRQDWNPGAILRS